MTDEQYRRLVAARRQGRNPDDPADTPAHKTVSDPALDSLLAAQDVIRLLREERDRLRAKIAELEAR